MTIEIVNHTADPAVIANYSTNRYVDGGYMEKEWEHVWRKSWLLAGLESDVQKPGDYFVFDMGREQILVTRTASGRVQGVLQRLPASRQSAGSGGAGIPRR